MPNELDEFLKGTEDQEQKLDILNEPLNPNQPPEDPEKGTDDELTKDVTPDDDDGEFKPRNRRERRLMQKLEDERHSSQFLAGKLEAMTGAQREVVKDDADYLKAIERIYGTDSPEAQLATDLLKKAIIGARDDAENRAYNRIQEERQRVTEAEQQASKELDNMIDDIEDSYGIEFTDGQEKSFFQLLEKMSPKDSDGNVIAYADHHTVWELFKERSTKRSDTGGEAKKLANRSLTQGASTDKSNLQDDSQVRFLREQGII